MIADRLAKRMHRPRPRPEASGASSLRFDYLVTVPAAWMVIGLFLDGWAHIHQPSLETFFTPWHGVLYSGFLATAAALVVGSVRTRRIPAGYEWALAGVGVFLAGGVADMAWHLVFGIEVSVEALLSPTHLLLAAGFMLMISGPLRAAWAPASDLKRQGWRGLAPALGSVTLGYSVLTFFTSYAHPFVDSYAANAFRAGDIFSRTQGIVGPPDPLLLHALGIGGILLQSGLLTAVVVAILRRWRPPFGAFTVMLGVDVALLSVLHDQFRLIPAAVLAGLVADVVVHWPGRRGARLPLRLVGALLPGTLYPLYFLTLALTGGVWWSVHLWTGSIVMAALVGLGVTSLAAHPGYSAEPRRVQDGVDDPADSGR